MNKLIENNLTMNNLLTFSESDFAYNLYQLIKPKINNLPAFWFEIIEANQPYLLFTIKPSLGFNNYFNNQYYKVCYQVFLSQFMDKKFNQLKMVKQIINEIISIKEVDNYEVYSLKINGEYVNDNFINIDFNEANFDEKRQSYDFEIEFLLKKKD